MIDYESDRNLVSVETIQEVRPIENADNIEAYKVRNWWVVSGKGDYQVGDSVVYFEIDSALPLDDPRFESYAKFGRRTVEGKDYHILRTVRLRGTYSQGTIMPRSKFRIAIEMSRCNGQPLQDNIGIGKWEPPLPDSGSGLQIGKFPTHIASKTDSPRVENFTEDEWAEIQKLDWIATEKIDGTSCTLARDGDELFLCSRDWQISLEDNRYAQAVRDFGLDEALLASEYDAIQMEIAGPSIQSNKLGLKKQRPFIFKLLKNKVSAPRHTWPAWALDLGAHVYDLELPGTIEGVVEQADGIKSLEVPERLTEGIVWHSLDGTYPGVNNSSDTFKSISRKYLSKEKD